MTAFATIAAAIVALLSAGTPVADVVEQGRRRPVPDGKATAVNVSLQRADGELFGLFGGPTDWTTEVIVECYARDRAGVGADAGADALLAAVSARLAADRTLGGLVGDLRPTTLEYDYDAQAEKTACIVIMLSVLHRTSTATLE